MNKITLLLKLYRKRQRDNIIMFILFFMLSAAISMVLFVQANNERLLKNQFASSGIAGGLDVPNVISELGTAFVNAENVLGIIASAAIMAGVTGGLSLIGFRNSNSTKALVMMQIYGMQKKDVFLKSLIDAVICGVPSSVTGHLMGYFLFGHFSEKILSAERLVGLGSQTSVIVFWKTLFLIEFIVFWGNLFFDLKVMERSPVEYMYNRRAKRKKFYHTGILFIEFAGTAGYALAFFHIKKDYVLVCGVIVLLLAVILFSVFHLFFGIFTKKKRRNLKINSLKDISFCFLCSRNKRDAALAVVISIGTIILCFAANILFNVSGILRNAYRDNMGYTSVIFADGFQEKVSIQKLLDDTGYKYTSGYSKLMNYSELNGMDAEDGQFWAFIVENQTDRNLHFSVPEGTFISEEYFKNKCHLKEREYSNIFGDRITYTGALKDNQYLSLVSYNFIVNKADYKLKIDETFSPVYLLNLSVEEEQRLRRLLRGYGCRLNTASELIDEIKTGMSEYIDILALTVGMIFVVTVVIFYAVISTDLNKRRLELYLYRIFGASFNKAQSIIFGEYLMIALISSFGVSFTVMLFGEIYFYCGLGKHFPFSISIMLVATGCAAIFVFVCCRVAAFLNTKTAGLEVIRDE